MGSHREAMSKKQGRTLLHRDKLMALGIALFWIALCATASILDCGILHEWFLCVVATSPFVCFTIAKFWYMTPVGAWAFGVVSICVCIPAYLSSVGLLFKFELGVVEVRSVFAFLGGSAVALGLACRISLVVARGNKC